MATSCPLEKRRRLRCAVLWQRRYAIRLGKEINVQGTIDTMGCDGIPKWYIHPSGKPAVSDFEKIYEHKIRPFEPEKPGEYTLLNTMNDMKENPVVQQIMEGMRGGILQSCGGATPLGLMQAAVACANGDMSAAELKI